MMGLISFQSSQTPVDLAVEVGHVGIAEYLLLHGAYISTSVNVSYIFLCHLVFFLKID